MTRINDLTGKRFGKLVVLSFECLNKGANWLCQCDCGRTSIVKTMCLTRAKHATKSCGCIKKHDLTGKRFGRLIVLNMDKVVKYGKTSSQWWYCKCDCGTLKTVMRQNLTSGDIVSCGCFKKEQLSANSCKRPYESRYNKFINQAKSRNLESEITYEDFVYLINTVQNCHYCFKTLTWSKFNVNANGGGSNLDRMDNEKGYLKDNVIPCCGNCNRGKGNMFTYNQWYKMTEPFRTGELKHV